MKRFDVDLMYSVVWGNCLLNARLNDYTEEFMILKENQSGFRQSYSTLDNIFSIFTLLLYILLAKILRDH
jgi:uncharacterized membrane protein YesL